MPASADGQRKGVPVENCPHSNNAERAAVLVTQGHPPDIAIMDDRTPRPPPCRRCWSWQVTSDSSGTGITCRMCNKRYSACRVGVVPGEDVPPSHPAAYRKRWKWSTSATVGCHEYRISPDWLYGRFFLLQVNLFCSGYWIILGSFYLKTSARLTACWFDTYHKQLLAPGSGYVKQRLIPDFALAPGHAPRR